MAHDLMIVEGKASMFYVGDPPWHGLGTQLPGPATAAEAMTAAGLDWEVLKLPLYAVAATRLLELPGRHVLVPGDRWGKAECPVFGVVGESYCPMQNREAFSFFDPIVSDRHGAIYHTAGALGNGERIWVLARLPRELEVVPGDVVEPYVLLSNSHDGKSSVQLKFTPIRVVCQNTLNAALRDGPTVRVSHRGDFSAKLESARTRLGLYAYRIDQPASEREERALAENLQALLDAGTDSLFDVFTRMAEVKLDQPDPYFRAVFPDLASKDPKDQLRIEEARLFSDWFFRNGTGNTNAEVAGTLWAAYNGVTEFVDHRGGRTMARPMSPERRLQSMWFGAGAAIKARALDEAVRRVSDSATPGAGA